MENQVNTSMKGRLPILISTLLLLTLAAITFFVEFVDLMGSIKYYFDSFADISSWLSWFVIVVVDTVAVIIFSIYMIKGRANTKGSLPVALILFAVADIAAIFINSISCLIAYSFFPYLIDYCMIELFIAAGFIMMMICVNQNFENRPFFFAACGVATMAQLLGVALGYYRLSIETFTALLVFGIFFVFGFLNKVDAGTQSAKHEETYYNGPFIPHQNVAYVPPVAPAPVQSAPVAAAPYTPPQNVAYVPPVAPAAPMPDDHVTVRMDQNGDLSPEHQLLFWKDNLEKGLITESEYIKRRDEVLREHFGK